MGANEQRKAVASQLDDLPMGAEDGGPGSGEAPSDREASTAIDVDSTRTGPMEPAMEGEGR